jgi:hypothetical protein
MYDKNGGPIPGAKETDPATHLHKYDDNDPCQPECRPTAVLQSDPIKMQRHHAKRCSRCGLLSPFPPVLVSKYQGIATNVSFVNQSAGWRISDNLV